MKNMHKGLTVPKWMLINHSKIPQMTQNLSVKIVCPSPKVWDFDEKRLHWAVHCPCPPWSKKKSSKFTWCALQMRSRSCRFKNLETTSAPKVKETPRSFSPQPWTSLSGSDHRRSHNRPGNKKNSWKYNNEKSLGGIKCISSTTPTMMIMMWYFDIAIFVMCPRTNQMIAACYN